MERLLERKKMLTQEYDKTLQQYQVIEEESQMRNIENINLLQKVTYFSKF